MKNPANFTHVTVTAAGITRTYEIHGRMHPALNKARREGQASVSYTFEGQPVTATFS